jgi:hypothetical protein
VWKACRGRGGGSIPTFSSLGGSVVVCVARQKKRPIGGMLGLFGLDWALIGHKGQNLRFWAFLEPREAHFLLPVWKVCQGRRGGSRPNICSLGDWVVVRFARPKKRTFGGMLGLYGLYWASIGPKGHCLWCWAFFEPLEACFFCSLWKACHGRDGGRTPDFFPSGAGLRCVLQGKKRALLGVCWSLLV